MAINETLAPPGIYGEEARAPLSVAYAAGATEDAILIPTCEVLAVLSFDAAGSASVEGTNSPHANVIAGTAVWKLWPHGTVAVTSDNICKGLTALRVIRAADGGFVAGQALSEAVPLPPFDSDKHFAEIGHVIDSRVGAGLARVNLHFN